MKCRLYELYEKWCFPLGVGQMIVGQLVVGQMIVGQLIVGQMIDFEVVKKAPCQK